MKITDTEIIKLDTTNKLVGIASIVIDDSFIVKGIKIIQGINGLFIAMPSKKNSDGEFMDIVHPINSSTREIIQKAILDKYKQILKEEK